MSSVIYFLRNKDNGWTKIGHTKDFESRYKQHKTSNPSLEFVFSAETNFASKIEAYLKNLFSKQCKHIEHFELTDAEIEEAKRTIEDLNHKLADIEGSREIRDLKDLKPPRHPTNSERELLGKIQEVKIQKIAIEIEHEILEAELKKSISDSEEIIGIASFKVQSRTSIDLDRLKSDMPEIFEKYKIETSFRTLRYSRKSIPD